MRCWRPLFALVVLAGCSSAPAADGGVDASTPIDASVDAPDASDAASAPDLGEPPHCPGPFAPPTAAELVVRHRLGIPDEAGCAMVLAQNSHMDIDWRNTFADYYSMFVENVLSSADTLLAGDPDYRYQVCEMAYLDEHVRRHPEQLASLHDAAMRGALRVVGGGITSPDTLLPTSEALVRDYLRGSLVAENLLGTRARAAWLPDSFGHSPTVPDLLSEMGYTSVAFARVDGLHDAYEHHHGEPLIADGSTAALLTSLGSADFVWVGPAGGELLAHWMPIRIYCQGDDIDHDGMPLPGGYLFGDDHASDPVYTNGRIAAYVGELTPYVKTPYLFVPIGCDFEPPRTALLDIVRRWNTTMYPTTGIWVVASTFEDYGDLLADRHGDLPRMTRDITPYFTGFFGSRLAVKSGAREAGDLLSQAEIVALLAEAVAGTPSPDAALATAWSSFAWTDHHDFITGTALDPVVTGEQGPLVDSLAATATTSIATSMSALAGALTPDPTGVASVVVAGTVGVAGPRESTVSLVLDPGVAMDLSADVPSQLLTSTRHADGSIATAELLLALPGLGPASYQRVALHAVAATGPVTVTDDGTTVTLADTSTGMNVTIDRATGLLTGLNADGADWLATPSLDLAAFDDQGGLYRIGSETATCTFTPDPPPDAGAITVTILERGPARARVQIMRGATTIELRLVAGLRRLDVDVDATAMMGQTLTASIHSAVTSATATFVHAAGSITRPPEYLYTPTFWPTVRALDRARADGSGLAILPHASTGIRYDAAGTLELMVSRDATSEACDVLGASGTEILHAALGFSLRPHAAAIDPLAEALAVLDAPAAQLSGAGTTVAPTGSLFALSGHGYVLSAVKHADRGSGVIVRVERTASDGAVDIASGLLPAVTVTRPDLLERDDVPAASHVALDAALVTLRVAP